MTDPALPYSHTDLDGRTFYHGTKAELKPGDMLQGGYSSNYTERRSPWIYFSETVFAATWGAELAKRSGILKSVGGIQRSVRLTTHSTGRAKAV